MSTTVTQSNFGGGHAEDIRTFANDECEKSLNFDIFTNPHKLIPRADSVAETVDTGTMDDIELSDVDISLIGSTYTLTASGFETSVSTKTAFYTKSAVTNGGALAWATQAVSASGTYVKNSGVVYKDKFYAMSLNAGTYTLFRYNSAGSVTTVGTIAATGNMAKPFVHPEDNVLYIVIGSTITSWNNTTLTTTTTILPSNTEATSITNYGTYLAIGVRQLRGNGNATVYLWGRDATLNTLQASIDFGEGNLIILENLNETLFAVMQPQNILSTAFTYRLKIRAYSGGSVQTIKSLVVGSTENIQGVKVKNEEKLYFGAINDDCLYCFGKNKAGNYVITKDRYYFNGVTIGSAFQGLSMIGDIIWAGFATTGGAYTLMRSKVLSSLGENASYASTSVYKTTINPLMPFEHRGKRKQLKSFKVYYTGKTSGTIAVKYLVDGVNSSATTTFESIISESTTAKEDYKNATQLADNQAFAAGVEYQFQLESTGGVEIKSYSYEYDIIND